MASSVGTGRSVVMLIDAAKVRALILDATIAKQVDELRVSPSYKLRSEMRAYLDKHNRGAGTKNNVFDQLKLLSNPGGVSLINLGIPSLDRTSEAFILPSGSRLTFGVTIRDHGDTA